MVPYLLSVLHFETVSLSLSRPICHKSKICYTTNKMAASSSSPPSSSSFPEEVLEHVFSFIAADKDRNTLSLVSKSWYEVERWSRRKIFIGNCYSVSPTALTSRFPEVKCVELKGKPHFADFDLVPDGWGGHVDPWIAAMARSLPGLEELRLKRMVVSDDCLKLIATSFKSFRVLVLTSCEGFTTDGLSAIAANCRNLKELDLRESEVDDLIGDWLSNFPNTFTSLVTLNIACLRSQDSISSLEQLVGRCPNLRSLLLNSEFPFDRLHNLLRLRPQLTELGTGAYDGDVRHDIFSNLAGALTSHKELKRLSLSGFWSVSSYLPAVYPICSGLTSLNLSYASIGSNDLIMLVSQSPNLERLWVLDSIEDRGLKVLSLYCKSLRELRVFPSDPSGIELNQSLTEQGLVSVSKGCPKLQSVLYFCPQMSNAALVTIAKNRPNLTRFRLCIIEPRTPDYLTQEPLDVGFGAIVEHCKNLRRLSLSGLLTDRVFEYIGTHAKKLEMLSIAFAGDSDLGLHNVLSGCDSIRKLEIRDCPFGDKALLANAAKLETMRSLWMSSCSVSFGACKILGQKLPRLNVEVIDERGPPDSRPDSCHVEKLYIYRTVAGPRIDTPGFVWTMNEASRSDQLS